MLDYTLYVMFLKDFNALIKESIIYYHLNFTKKSENFSVRSHPRPIWQELSVILFDRRKPKHSRPGPEIKR